MKNRTSAIRSGFDYQDLWGLKFCGDWLQNPSNYEWIQFETEPEEINDANFHLDDIVLINGLGKYDLYQIKHRQNPQNAWTWEDLLNAPKKRTSLIKKWFSSLNRNIDIGEAAFITNGIASHDVEVYLNKDKIQIDRVKNDNPELYKLILTQFENEKKALEFFSIFSFRFQEKDIASLEEEIRTFFYRDIRATTSGINNILLQIHKECRKQTTEQLTLSKLQEWCEFDTPEPLVEDFLVPDDFEFFDEETHKNILKDLSNPTGGIKILVGKPGTGKSVYLSELHKVLTDSKIISVRHHYHLSPEDTNPQERLNANRVIEAIKSQLKEFPDKLGSLANKNSQGVEPREFIHALATNLKKEGRSFVMIIDGLDHVIRNLDISELKKFLQEICYPQPGLWIVLGMQHVVLEQLPPVVNSKCKAGDQIEMPGLNRKSIEQIILKNLINLNLPDNDTARGSFITKVFDITQGNPLHLRYVLSELKTKNGRSSVNEYSLEDVVPYGGDISNYYQALWSQLSDKAKSLLFVISSANFLFKKKQLIECVSSFETDSTKISRAFREIVHLIKEDRKSRISVYHNSFEVFLLEQPSFEEQRIVLKNNIKKWLEKCSYENLRWAELKKIEYEVGNSKPIMSLDKSWLINAICYPRNFSQISYQLDLASKASFESGEFAKTLIISHLQMYHANTPEFVEEGYERIFAEAVLLNQDVINDVEVGEIETDNLSLVATIADTKGDFSTVEEITNLLIKRQEGHEYNKKGQGSISLLAKALLQTIPLDRSHSVRRIYRYIKQFSDLGWTTDFFKIYASTLLRTGQIEKTKTLLNQKLSDHDYASILEKCIKDDLVQGKNNFQEFYKSSKKSLLTSVYLMLNGDLSVDLPNLPSFESLPKEAPEFDTNGRIKWENFFHQVFLKGLIFSFTKNEKRLDEWIKNSPDIWSARAVAGMFASARIISKSILSDSKISYQDLFIPLKSLDKLKWPEDREKLELQFGFINALSRDLREVVNFKKILSDNLNISIAGFRNILDNPFFSLEDLLDVFIDAELGLLSNEAFQECISRKETEVEQAVNYFPDRTVAYAKLAKLSRIHSKQGLAKSFLLKAADNLLGYGYHKDLYLDGVMDAIGFCGESDVPTKQINAWLSEISPIVENVTDYTDGDETNYLSNDLAELLGKYNQPKLFNNYYSHADTEDLFHAQKLFKYVIRSLSYKNETEVALGATALDKESFLELKELSSSNKDAKKSLDRIEKYLGSINYSEESNSSSSSNRDEQTDFSKISPSKILLEFEKKDFKSKWEMDGYLTGWVSYWILKVDKEIVYRAVKPLIYKIGLRTVSGDLLDIVYPLAFEFDNNEAFEFICRAQANDNGWQKYWTDKSKAEQRWSFIKEKYPNRYLEFFEKSIGYSNRRYTDSANFIPISKGVEFFTIFGDIPRAEQITKASIEFAKLLMANINLKPPLWETDLYKDNNLSEIDLLFQRLTWPSPLVRERVANEIADLLLNSPKNKEMYFYFLRWIERQTLESVLAIALLPFFKLHSVLKDQEISFIRLEEIVNSLPLSSVVIDKLIEELAFIMGENCSAKPGYVAIETYPEDYQVDAFFKKFIKGFLAPIYHNRAVEIEKSGKAEFIKQWAFTSEQLITENNVERNANHAHFQGRDKGESLVGMSTKLGEVYRSAFLRVLQHFYALKSIREDFYLEYAYATLPIDLFLWRVLPQRVPNWWPKLATSSNNKEGLMSLDLNDPIENLVKVKNGRTLLLAEGGILTQESGKDEDPFYSFSLMGFGYKVVGPNIPDAEKVAEKILHRPTVTLIPSDTEHPFSFLQNHPDLYYFHSEVQQIEDLVVYPFISRVRDLTISLWQFFRDYNTFCLPAGELSQDLNIALSLDKIYYKDDQGKSKIIINDWIEGLKERNDSDLSLPCGEWIDIDHDYLKSILEEEGIRIGYLLKTSYRHKQYKYEDVKNLDQYKLVNLSSVILP